MPEREYPRWLYFPDGTAVIVQSAVEEATYPPGHEDTPGKFLPPDHVGYVPRTVDVPEPEPPEPPTVIEYENEPIPIIVLENDDPVDEPVISVKRTYRKRKE